VNCFVRELRSLRKLVHVQGGPAAPTSAEPPAARVTTRGVDFAAPAESAASDESKPKKLTGFRVVIAGKQLSDTCVKLCALCRARTMRTRHAMYQRWIRGALRRFQARQAAAPELASTLLAHHPHPAPTELAAARDRQKRVTQTRRHALRPATLPGDRAPALARAPGRALFRGLSVAWRPSAAGVAGARASRCSTWTTTCASTRPST
jgi:hypothetical protein